jgi:hypothetical protein
VLGDCGLFHCDNCCLFLDHNCKSNFHNPL